MKNVYLDLTRAVDRLPKLKTVNKSFADGMKEYWVSSEAEFVPNCEKVQLKLVEEYFGKYKDGKCFEELPFFKKITETKPSYGDRGLVITRSNGKGLSTETTVNSEGIRQYKVEKRLNKDGTHYNCTRYIYNENGTKPTIISSWVKPVG